MLNDQLKSLPPTNDNIFLIHKLLNSGRLLSLRAAVTAIDSHGNQTVRGLLKGFAMIPGFT